MLQKLKAKLAKIIYNPPPPYIISMLLPSNAETAWKGLRAKTRNMVRKHANLGRTIYTGLDSLGVFYALYSNRMEVKDAKGKSYDMLKDIMQNSGNRILYTEYSNDVLMGGAIIEYVPHKAIWVIGALTSEFLLWHIVKECIVRQIDTFELGRSQAGSGSFKFKRHFCGKFASLTRAKE